MIQGTKATLPKKTKKRILVIGDAAYPMSTTGFAIVLGKVIPGLVDAGFEVAHLARGLREAQTNEPNFRVYLPNPADPNGFVYINDVATWEKPDLVFINADPSSIMEFRRSQELRRVPNLVYVPTEGGPLMPPWSDSLREILYQDGRIATYTNFSRQVIENSFILEDGSVEPPKHELTVLGHGWDHAPFRKYDDAERDAIRQSLGWTDKFMIINIARNAGRKMWVSLFETMSHLAHKYSNVRLYAHTVPYESFFLGGHNLLEWRRYFGLEGKVQFHSELRDGTKGIQYEGIGQDKNNIGLIDLLNAADLFVSTSGGEGWNLPLLEAAACGLPIMTPAYAGAWEWSQKFASGITPRSWETHSSGVRFASVDPEQLAYHIGTLIRNPEIREKRAALAYTGAQALKSWQPTVDGLVKLAKELTG